MKGRPTNQVCYRCRELLEDGQKYRAHQEAMKAAMDRQEYWIPENWCHPRYRPPHINLLTKEAEPFDQLGETMAALAQRLGEESSDTSRALGPGAEPTPQLYPPTGYDAHWDWEHRAYFSAEIAEMLQRLNLLITQVIDVVAEHGIQYGSDALLQLAGGHVTVEKFNNATLREEE